MQIGEALRLKIARSKILEGSSPFGTTPALKSHTNAIINIISASWGLSAT